MTIVTTIDPARRFVLTQLDGLITGTELTEYEKNLARLPNFQADFAQLVDASGATWDAISSSYLRTLAVLTPFLPTAQRAYVVRGQFGRMLAIIYGVHSSLNEQYFYVTDQLDMAYGWLALNNTAMAAG